MTLWTHILNKNKKYSIYIGPPLKVLYVLSVKLYCLFPCLLVHIEISLYVLSQGIPVAFIYTFCMLPCKMPMHACNMDRPVPPPCCLWVMPLSRHHCRLVGPWLSWRAIISPWPWWAVGPLPVMLGPMLGDPGRPCVLGPLESPCPTG